MFDTTHLHPMIVHFPIALLIVGLVFDLAGLFIKKEFFSTAGFYLLILGTLGIVAAYFSGDFAGDGISEAGPLKQALETHEDAAVISLWLFAASVLLRGVLVWKKKYTGIFKYAAIALIVLGVLSVARTGYYGGQLVFKHAAGVQLSIGLDSSSSDSEKAED